MRMIRYILWEAIATSHMIADGVGVQGTTITRSSLYACRPQPKESQEEHSTIMEKIKRWCPTTAASNAWPK